MEEKVGMGSEGRGWTGMEKDGLEMYCFMLSRGIDATSHRGGRNRSPHVYCRLPTSRR